MTDERRLRCRASAWDARTGQYQCSLPAKYTREMGFGYGTRPVCHVHSRSRVAYFYTPGPYSEGGAHEYMD